MMYPNLPSYYFLFLFQSKLQFKMFHIHDMLVRFHDVPICAQADSQDELQKKYAFNHIYSMDVTSRLLFVLFTIFIWDTCYLWIKDVEIWCTKLFESSMTVDVL